MIGSLYLQQPYTYHPAQIAHTMPSCYELHDCQIQLESAYVSRLKWMKILVQSCAMAVADLHCIKCHFVIWS